MVEGTFRSRLGEVGSAPRPGANEASIVHKLGDLSRDERGDGAGERRGLSSRHELAGEVLTRCFLCRHSAWVGRGNGAD